METTTGEGKSDYILKEITTTIYIKIRPVARYQTIQKRIERNARKNNTTIPKQN
jgi:hypothetical protein